ncbi:MFS transporter [Fluviibacter phosphoraccumulans]|uniref:MFS transporter n=2 Tax=Fluviibacter phosphoraccumulans TaxID=1751046 RepID=A0A679HUU4_9RHOO|nr:MFS transporter [Fluviibacter phosphoraccumulans]BBU70899.1 MFS transporter [Fluviibacter phosphoraccumulans]BCA65748.1 MFS transporter [Fluviibacter phosphoraccumulans]
MLGLFIVLPVFAVAARDLTGGQDVAAIGLALGAYGLTQACLQLPFGILADHWGRKPVIACGLALFVAGSIVCALADSISAMTLGRMLQGSGAISAAITALVADLTRDSQRSKAMAMVGGSIALMFALSLAVAPVIFGWVGLGGLFWLTCVLGLGAFWALFRLVPAAPPLPAVVPGTFRQMLVEPRLIRLNLGVFILHAIQIAMWVAVPALLIQLAGLPLQQHWMIYVPAVVASFFVLWPAMMQAERHKRMAQVFAFAVVLIGLVQLGFVLLVGHGDLGQLLAILLILLLIAVFFTGFNILEALQPSLISRIAPATGKARALGIYNTLQSLGLFVGGAMGGWLLQTGGYAAVFAGCGLLALVWLIILVKWPARVPAETPT